MRILAFDSSEAPAAVCLCDNEKLLGEYTVTSAGTHSETLLPMISSLLRSYKTEISDIDMIACSVGPGSFTGVRIAVSAAKGLAFERNIPCVPVSTLEALAYNLCGLRGIVCPCMDARREQLYNAVFRCDGERLCALEADRVISAKELACELEEKYSGEPIYFVGSGYDIMARACEGRAIDVRTVPEPQRYERGYSVAACAFERYSADPSCAASADTLAPVYLRPSQAERERNERLKGR